MSKISITVTDAVESQRQTFNVPADAQVVRLVATLVKQLNMPLTSPDGAAMSYKLHHKESQRQLNDQSTLQDSSVSDGDTLRLIPEIIAG